MIEIESEYMPFAVLSRLGLSACGVFWARLSYPSISYYSYMILYENGVYKYVEVNSPKDNSLIKEISAIIKDAFLKLYLFFIEI